MTPFEYKALILIIASILVDANESDGNPTCSDVGKMIVHKLAKMRIVTLPDGEESDDEEEKKN